MEKKNTTFGTSLNFNRKIIERGKIDTPNTQIYDNSLSWLGTGTAILGTPVSSSNKTGGRRGRDCKVVGFTTTCATNAYYH